MLAGAHNDNENEEGHAITLCDMENIITEEVDVYISIWEKNYQVF